MAPTDRYTCTDTVVTIQLNKHKLKEKVKVDGKVKEGKIETKAG